MRRFLSNAKEYLCGFGPAVAVAVMLFSTPSIAFDLDFTAARFEPAGDDAKAPEGWSDFCERYGAPVCTAAESSPRDIDMTDALWAELVQVNNWVNIWVQPQADMQHWGVADRWDYPLDGHGDCEDYALLKQLILISKGVPQEDLLMTVVMAHRNEGHAVLTVHTNQGDFVLDSNRNDVVPWSRSAYGFVKRQSRRDPNNWIYIDGISSRSVIVADNGD